MARDDTLLSRAEAAKALGIALRTLDLYVHDGHLKSVRRPRHGRRIGRFVRRSEIARFLRERQRRAEEAA